MDLERCLYRCLPVCDCILPVGLKVSQPSLQIIEKIDFLAALRTVDVQKLTIVQLPHLLWSLSSTRRTKSMFTVLIKQLCTCASLLSVFSTPQLNCLDLVNTLVAYL